MIAEWDRATRSMVDGIKIMTRIAERGAVIRVLDKPWLDLSTPSDRASSRCCPVWRKMNGSGPRRANEGRAIARENGEKFGRKPKLTEHQRSLALDRLAVGGGQLLSYR